MDGWMEPLVASAAAAIVLSLQTDSGGIGKRGREEEDCADWIKRFLMEMKKKER
jgi:hypothetical protein